MSRSGITSKKDACRLFAVGIFFVDETLLRVFPDPDRIQGKDEQDRGAGIACFLHPNAPVVEVRDFPDKGEPEPDPSQGTASGLIYPEEGLEDAVAIAFGDARAAVLHADLNLRRRLFQLDGNASFGKVVFDRIFDKIEYRAVDEDVASLDKGAFSVVRKRDGVLFRKWRQVVDYLFDEGGELDCVRPGDGFKLAHVEQCPYQLRQTVHLV